MKKTYITSILLLGLMPFLTHCASQQEVETLNYHVRSINKKLEDMKINTVGQMQQRQASSSGVLDQVQGDILQLKSQLEENAHMTRLLQEQNKELQLAIGSLQTEQKDELDAKLAEIDSKIVLQQESLTAMQQARVQEAERRSKAAAIAADEAMRKARQASSSQPSTKTKGVVHLRPRMEKILLPQATTTTSAPPPSSQATKTSSPAVQPPKTSTPTPQKSDSYNLAQQKFRDGKYDEAFKLFEATATKKGSQESIITARYMMGECLFRQGEYDQAIIQYQQIISTYPGNPQAARALLRQGEAFEQLSDNETAKIIYKKLAASYGSSPEAATAKKRISSL
ncbi:MAG: tetratricopeptide repeat protein [Thermodesulfobacteriota bacterium]